MPNDIIVLDLETARSADDCKHCRQRKEEHRSESSLCHYYVGSDASYEPIGWTNKPALGLSIGGYYSYVDDRIHWFDEHNLEATIVKFVDEQPLMVSFNGIGFDFPLMRGILRQREGKKEVDQIDGLNELRLGVLCDAFKTLAANSYDILAEIWQADPSSKFKKGLNSLDAIAQANGLGAKISHGAQAPRDWAAGKHADVINYCQDDILKTRALFEKVRATKGYLLRGDGSELALRWVTVKGDLAEAVDFTDLPF